MKVFKYGDNVDTDVIIPARHLNNPDPKALASHCMEDIDADFAKTVQPGDIIVAAAEIQAGDQVKVDFATGKIVDETTGKEYQAAPFPAFVSEIIDNGGLLRSLKVRGVAK